METTINNAQKFADGMVLSIAMMDFLKVMAEAVEKQPETLEAMEAMLAAIAEAQTPAEA